MSILEQQVNKRRTFAIISHPDAGKTTLTEKLLLFGGAIQQAGAVKARGERRRARSDWMAVERDRGISVSASVMTFEHGNLTFNLLDTPGHEDFSEDTYRTLSAVDSVIMVLDAAKGIEAQTLKLFEVCRLRDIPIITFVNKLDRESLDTVELIDEVETKLQIEVTPASWPIGMGDRFRGCFDLRGDRLIVMRHSRGETIEDSITCQGVDDPAIEQHLGDEVAAQLREDIEMARELCPPMNEADYLAGNLTPMYFGSALNNFGITELLHGLSTLAPSPRPQIARNQAGEEQRVMPHDDRVSGFVFKVQANMDPRHRDRVAFVRLCSGHFRRGMKLVHQRSGKTIAIHNPVLFMARDRERADEAWAGDIIGIPNHGNLSIGDSLCEGEALRFRGIPSFAPEVLRTVRATDPMRSKHLGRALTQLAEEGVARVFKPLLGASWIVGVVGPLQIEVLTERIKVEYNIPVVFETTSLLTARWVDADDQQKLRTFIDKNQEAVATDHENVTVFLARNQWHLDRTIKDNPDLRFHKTREQLA